MSLKGYIPLLSSADVPFDSIDALDPVQATAKSVSLELSMLSAARLDHKRLAVASDRSLTMNWP